MNLNLKVTTNRNNLNNVNTKMPFSQHLKETMMEEDLFYFRTEIAVYHKKKKIALMWIDMFDEGAILNEGETLEDVADMIDGDLEAAMSYLSSSEVIKKPIDEEVAMESLYDGYIELLWVDPKYRQKGIARYLLNNVHEILLHSCNTRVRCLVAAPWPYATNLGTPEGSENTSPVMKGELLVEMLERYGYDVVGGKDDNFHAKNYEEVSGESARAIADSLVDAIAKSHDEFFEL